MSQINTFIKTSGPGSGTVTSISAGTGITLTPNPITTTGTVALTIPVVVSSGGTGQTTLTNHGLLVGAGTAAITQLANATNGQLPIGSTGLDPVLSTLTAGTGISITNAAGSITIAVSGSAVIETITGDSGGAFSPVAGNFNFTGGTTGLTFAGSAATETLTGTLVVANGGTGKTTLTAHGVLIGEGTSAVAVTAAGTTGQVLTGVTGADPVWASPAASSISITGDSGGALTSNAFTFTGGTTGLTFAGAGTTETLGGTLVVSNGGTGRATLTNHGLLVGAGTSAITQLANATNGQLPIGSTGADPVLAAITAGTGISISNGAGSITINATGSGLAWSVITANQTAAVNNGYFCNKAGTLALALPASSAVGDTIEVTNENTALGVQFTQAAGQQILIGNTNTTLGATGTLTSSAVGDTLTIVCYVANTIWRTTGVVGNWTPA